MPEISVIINAQNGEKYLRQAIDSVFAQTFRDIELIVFDDASTDGTGDIARSYGNRIIYLRSETQVPLGKARNLALRSARGVYVAFLDQDDIWLPEKLECQHRVFFMYGDTALVYTNVTVFNDRTDLYMTFRKRVPPTGMIFRDLLAGFSGITISSVMFRRSALGDMKKWFDEEFYLIEDYDFLLRLSLAGRIEYCPEPLTKWRLNPSGWSQKRCELFASEKEKMLMAFMRDIPRFENEYADEIISLKDEIGFDRAKAAWRAGRNAEARAFFRGKFSAGRKYAACYVFSFFPYRFYEYLRNVFFRYFTEEHA